jgi:hypothetical protein
VARSKNGNTSVNDWDSGRTVEVLESVGRQLARQIRGKETEKRESKTGVIYEVDPQVKHTGISHTVSGGFVSLGLV